MNITLENSLDKYIKQHKTQEECVGFIDGFNVGSTIKLNNSNIKQYFDSLSHDDKSKFINETGVIKWYKENIY